MLSVSQGGAMRVLRIGFLWALGAAASACSSDGTMDVSGSWAGTMTDERGARTISGNCNHGESARCSFTVTDPAQGGSVSQATLTGVVTTDATSAEILSFVLSVVPPPCSITVSGDARVSGRSWEAKYGGMDNCAPGGAVHDGRLSLTRQ
jgi:hypothetical protein